MRVWAQSVTTALLVVLLAAVATTMGNSPGHGVDAVVRAAQTTGASATASPDRPNVVLVLTDDMRRDDLEHMPITQRLLVDRGMTFPEAISPHPLCCPARAELVTGQYAQNNGVQHNRGPHGGFEALDPTREVSSWFSSAGYRTGFVGKFLNGYGPQDDPPLGWTRWDALQAGVYNYLDFTFAGDGDPVSFTDDYVTDAISRRTDDTIRDFAAAGDPFVVFSWHLAPHYRIGPGKVRTPPPAAPADRDLFRDARPPSLDDAAFDERDVSDQPHFLNKLPRVDTSEVVVEHRARLRALQSVDRAVGSLVETLEQTGELDDTYIVFTSDNGYSLGEHRYVGKDVLTEESLRVPLVVRGPGIAPGTTSHLPVTIVDLPSTFADLAGLTPGWLVDGVSLAPTLAGQVQEFRDTTLIQTGSVDGNGWAWRGVRTDRYSYATEEDEALLYDHLLDPDELVNRADDPAYAEVRAALERRRAELVSCRGWTCNQLFGMLPEPLLAESAGVSRGNTAVLPQNGATRPGEVSRRAAPPLPSES